MLGRYLARMPESRDPGETSGHGEDSSYTTRLVHLSGAWWKKVIRAQAPYRRNIRRIAEDLTLDVGCGIGRNLTHLDGNGVGVDINPHSIEVARRHGLIAYTPDEFTAGPHSSPASYGTLLFAHVLEHMELTEAIALVTRYLPYLKPGGRVVVIVPQEASFRTDATHVARVDSDEIRQIAESTGLVIEDIYSFPFPRSFGRFFRHNETVALLRQG